METPAITEIETKVVTETGTQAVAAEPTREPAGMTAEGETVQKARRELVNLKAMAIDNAKLKAEVTTMKALIAQANLQNSQMREAAQVPDLKLGAIPEGRPCSLPEISAHRSPEFAGSSSRSNRSRNGAAVPQSREMNKAASLPSLR
jgi:hypothetical protein